MTENYWEHLGTTGFFRGIGDFGILRAIPAFFLQSRSPVVQPSRGPAFRSLKSVWVGKNLLAKQEDDPHCVRGKEFFFGGGDSVFGRSCLVVSLSRGLVVSWS